MTKLIAVISPAKLLDDQSHYPELQCTQPQFLKESESLVLKLKKLSGSQLAKLMDISEALGALNKLRYSKWETPFTHENAHPAILMFKGDVYRGMQAESFSKPQLKYAQDHLRILSGLYGLNKPLDLVMPYRLMMGTPFSPSAKFKNLYDFWGSKIAYSLNQELHPNGVLVNLASTEYFKSISTKALDRKIVHCEFREKKGTGYSIVSTFAKLARGKMARFLVEHEIENANDMKAFDTDKYQYYPSLSTQETFVFTRSV